MNIVKASIPFNTDSLEILTYGGLSKIFIDDKNKYCYKVYRDGISMAKRDIVLENFIGLHNNAKVMNNNNIILPHSLFLDQEGILICQKILFISGIKGSQIIQQFYMSKRYNEIIENLIKATQKATRDGLVITDLKLSNFIVDNQLNIKIIDNDFSVLAGDDKLDKIARIFNNFYIKRYLELFGGNLNINYNYYILTIIVAMMIIDPLELNNALSKSVIPNYKVLKEINLCVQRNRCIPQKFKMECRNLFAAHHNPILDEELCSDISEYILRKSRKRC